MFDFEWLGHGALTLPPFSYRTMTRDEEGKKAKTDWLA
jgi:hypothetical protein